MWKPPVDPATGAVVWDQAEAPAAAPPKKARGWRKAGRARPPAGGATAAALLAEPSGAGTPAAGSPTTVTQPEGDAFAGLAPPAEPGGDVGAPPTAADPQDQPDAVVGSAGGVDRRHRWRRLLRGEEEQQHHHRDHVVTNPSPSPAVADAALAASINLRLTDLPAGWTQTSGAGQVPTTSLAPAAAQTRANQALASCLGQSVAVVTGLFGGGTLPGQTASVRSPSFQSGADPNIQMFSDTRVFQTTADAQSLGAPFTNANFATCFGQYQSTLVSAAVPGATAQVQTVQLQSPGRRQALRVPDHADRPQPGNPGDRARPSSSGGRIETLLEPTTNGPPVPSGPFTAAYNAVTGRMAPGRRQVGRRQRRPAVPVRPLRGPAGR